MWDGVVPEHLEDIGICLFDAMRAVDEDECSTESAMVSVRTYCFQPDNKERDITYCFRPWRYFIISAPHSARLAFPYPGISSKTTLCSPPFVPPIPNAFISLVRPGFEDVQQTSCPIIAFKSELLPTFDRPRNATSGSTDESGVVRNLAADQSFKGE